MAGMLLVSAGAKAETPKSTAGRPNVLLIVADDLGYNDLSVFGSEIQTPNIDSLAANGTILTSYYTAPLCAPTRSMLMSGTDMHRAGEGIMDQAVEGVPGYDGHLSQRVVSLATRLQSSGYHTYMAGKWHLGETEELGPKARGFERSFALLQGAGDHFSLRGIRAGVPSTYREGAQVVTKLPANFYSTTAYTDRMLDYLKSSPKDGKPFFAYLAYTAPHWPMEAPDADIAKQRGHYADGYEVLRQQRFAAWKAKGFAGPNAELPNLPPDYKPWSALSDTEKAASSRTMEVYAAMVERMDTEIGRVLSYLKASGQLDNTLVIFQSDNGAEGGGFAAPDQANNALDNIGRPGSWTSIGRGWAEAASAPYYLEKYWATEGGIHVPAIVSAPKLGVRVGARTGSLLLASDIAPTLLQLAGAPTTAPADKPDALPITGRSFLPILRGDESGARTSNDLVGWEHKGNAAVRLGDWKLTWVAEAGFLTPAFGKAGAPPSAAGAAAAPAGAAPAGALPATPGAGVPEGVPGPRAPLKRASLEVGGPAGTPSGAGGPWHLYNVKEDPAELHDLSAQHPDIVKQLLAGWDTYVAENGVIVKTGAAQ